MNLNRRGLGNMGARALGRPAGTPELGVPSTGVTAKARNAVAHGAPIAETAGFMVTGDVELGDVAGFVAAWRKSGDNSTGEPEPAEDSNVTSLPEASEALKTISPIVSDILSDVATRDPEVLKAKIRNHERMMNSVPEPLKTYYRNRLNVLRARLKAALARKAQEGRRSRSFDQFSILGKAGLIVGIAVGGAAVVWLLKDPGPRKGSGSTRKSSATTGAAT